MNNRNLEYCQHKVNDEHTEVSVDILSDLVEFIASVAPARLTSYVPQETRDSVLAEIDTVKAEFAITADTPDELKLAVLSDEQLADLDAAMANFDLQGKRAEIYEAQVSAPIDSLEPGARLQSPAKAAREAWQAKRAPDKEANKRFGHTAQAMDAIDAHRKTEEGRIANAKMQRDTYRAMIEDTKGRAVRAYVHHKTPAAKKDARQQTNATSEQKRRDSMTPAEKKAENLASAQRRRDRKERKKQEAAKAIADKAIM